METDIWAIGRRIGNMAVALSTTLMAVALTVTFRMIWHMVKE